MMFKNKKAMFFTLMAMLIISLLIFALTNPPKNVTGFEDLEPITTRIQNLNDFVNSINSIYLNVIIKTTTYNILESIAAGEIGLSGTLVETIKHELETNETNENSAYYWFNKLDESAKEAHHSDFTINSFFIKSITQQENEPYTVSVELYIDYTVNSADPNLYWNVIKPSKIVKVNIIGLSDPDNGGQPIKPITAGGSYYVNTIGQSYLEKLGGETLFSNTKLCPGIGCA